MSGSSPVPDGIVGGCNPPRIADRQLSVIRDDKRYCRSWPKNVTGIRESESAMLLKGRTALALVATGESGMETGEVPNRGVGRLEAYWTGVLERVKKQSEARHSKEGAAAWCEDQLSRDDSAIDADNERNKRIDFKA